VIRVERICFPISKPQVAPAAALSLFLSASLFVKPELGVM